MSLVIESTETEAANVVKGIEVLTGNFVITEDGKANISIQKRKFVTVDGVKENGDRINESYPIPSEAVAEVLAIIQKYKPEA